MVCGTSKYASRRRTTELLRFLNMHLQLASAQIGKDLNIFQTLAEDPNPVTVAELAERTGAASLLLSRS